MAAVAGSGPFESGGDAFGAARLEKRPCVIRPRLLVEIGGEEPAGLVGKQGINARDEIAGARVAAAQVPFDDLVRRRYERLMRTFAAFDLGLAADALDPLVGARGRIAGPPRPGVLPPHRKDIRPAGEQATKQGEFLGGRRTAGDRRIVERGGACGIIGRRQLALEIGECRFQAHALRIEFSETSS